MSGAACPRLYLVTDRRASSRPLPQLIDEALSGVDPRKVAVQLREKDLTARELLLLGAAVLEVCRTHGVPLLVNDRLDVAHALGAAGVHLGGGSIPALEARRLLGRGALIGVSCHSPAELRARREGADFAVWGPVFETPSKAAFGEPVGFDGLDEARALQLPLVAIGGVTTERAAELKARGFSGVSCIRAVLSAQDPARAARELLAAFEHPPTAAQRG